MKKLILAVLAVVGISPAIFAEDTAVCSVKASNPFVYTSGNFSAGVVAGDVYQSWDIFKKVKDINGRTGGSVTFLQYGRLGAYVGAAAPSSDPGAVSVDFGPQINLDDVSKAAIQGMIKVLPFKIDGGTADAISSAFTLKLKWGYDFRNEGSGIGVGVGIKKVF